MGSIQQAVGTCRQTALWCRADPRAVGPLCHHPQHLDMGRASTFPIGCPEDQETICMDEQFLAPRGRQQMLITNNLRYFWQKNPE